METYSPADTERIMNKYASNDYFWEGVYPFMDQKDAGVVMETLKETLSNT